MVAYLICLILSLFVKSLSMNKILKSVYVSPLVGVFFGVGLLSSYILRILRTDKDSSMYYIPDVIFIIAVITGAIDKKSRYTIMATVAIALVSYYLIKFFIDNSH